MTTTVLYDVTFAAVPRKRLLHIHNRERFVACVRAVEDHETFRAYHYHNGKHLVPDYAAIRSAIPHYHVKALDRAGTWWFPLTLRSALSNRKDPKNACSVTLRDAKGKTLGTLYATPFVV